MEEYIRALFKSDSINLRFFTNYFTIFDRIFIKDKSLEFAKKVLDIIINNCLEEVVDYDSMINDFLLFFEDDGDVYNALYDYIDKRFVEIAKNLNAAALTIYESEIPRYRKIIKQVLDSDIDKKLDEIIRYRIFSSLSIRNYDDIDVNFVKFLFKDIMNYEQKKLSDVIFNERGTYSCVHIIGDKVFKIGKRETFRIKNDRRYLKPVLRKEINVGNDKFCFEITERVSNNVTHKDLDKIVYECEKKGKYWDDKDINNIGKLIKPNKVYYKYPILGDTGYIDVPEEDIVLPEGEIVIIDNDFMYDNYQNFVKVYK